MALTCASRHARTLVLTEAPVSVPQRRSFPVTTTGNGIDRNWTRLSPGSRFTTSGKATTMATTLPLSPAPAGSTGVTVSTTAEAVSPDTDVESIARLAMRQMGKEYGSKQAELVENLRDELYDTAAAIAELREDQLPGLAQQWKAPHRLLATMHRIAVAATTAAATSPPQQAVPLAGRPAPAAVPEQPSGLNLADARTSVLRAVYGLEAEGAEGVSSAIVLPPEARPMGHQSTQPHRPHPPSQANTGTADVGTNSSLGNEHNRAVVTERGLGSCVDDDARLRGQQQERPQKQEVGQVRRQRKRVQLRAEPSDEEEEGLGFSDDEEAEEDEQEEDGEEGSMDESYDSDLDQGGTSLEGSACASAARGHSGGRAAGGKPQTEEQQVDIRQLSIMERRCPEKFRFGHGSGRSVRLTNRKLGEAYALKEAETPSALAAELREFEAFSLYGSFAGAQHGEPVRRVTLDGYLQCVRQALGWLHRIEGVPLEELRLGLLVPGTNRGAARRVHAYLMWQERERSMVKRSVARSLAALIQVAKFLYHEHSQAREGDKPYSDLEVIKTLRAMYMGYERAERVSGHVVDSAVKWMDWPDYLEYVGELRKECAALKATGRPRSRMDVAMSLQSYLIAAILSCVPDRQRTLRELVVGRTLVKDKNGIWSIRHSHADYKTGGTYGERPPLVIDPGIYYELEEFIGTWRAYLKPQHDFLFSKRDGSAPLTAQELSRSFSLNAFRITGRKLNPHMVRDMVVTYARSGHASEHELEALAIYMGHSLAEQRGTYDRRTKAQKVQPAMGLLAKISGTSGITAAVASAGGLAALSHDGASRFGAATAQATAAEKAAPVSSINGGSRSSSSSLTSASVRSNGLVKEAAAARSAATAKGVAPPPAVAAPARQAARSKQRVKAEESAVLEVVSLPDASDPVAASAEVDVAATAPATAVPPTEVDCSTTSLLTEQRALGTCTAAPEATAGEAEQGRRSRTVSRKKTAVAVIAVHDVEAEASKAHAERARVRGSGFSEAELGAAVSDSTGGDGEEGGQGLPAEDAQSVAVTVPAATRIVKQPRRRRAAKRPSAGGELN